MDGVRWLDRRIAKPGPHLALCLSEAEYLAATKHLNISSPSPWINAGADATMHTFETQDGQQSCIVCLGPVDERSPIEIAGLLVHEATHIWQRYAESMGEDRPGAEQEAYAIQAISQELMEAYAQRIATCNP
jgi:hypothetical protein